MYFTEETKRLKEIEDREVKALEGPWEVDAGGYVCTVKELPVFGTPDRMRHELGGQYRKSSACLENMEFIAQAREDIPWLIARVKSLEKELIAEWEEQIREDY